MQYNNIETTNINKDDPIAMPMITIVEICWLVVYKFNAVKEVEFFIVWLTYVEGKFKTGVEILLLGVCAGFGVGVGVGVGVVVGIVLLTRAGAGVGIGGDTGPCC